MISRKPETSPVLYTPRPNIKIGGIIREFKITADSKAKELASFALALHNLIKLPLTIRSLNEKGVRIEGGRIIDYSYTGPVLEQVLMENRLIRTVPRTGIYRGKSVIVAPIQDADGRVVAAIGLSDAYGALDFIECFCRNPAEIEDVEKCLMEKGVEVPGQ